jgi:Glycosyltransferase
MRDTMKKLIQTILPKPLLEQLRKIRKRMRLAYVNKAHIKQFDASRWQKGINLIGPLNQNSGLGQSCRLLENELASSKIPYKTYNYSSEKPRESSRKIKNNLLYRINVFHINAHELEPAFCALKNTTWNWHYNIAFWLWELEEFPDGWTSLIRLFDEIWTPSEFVSESIRKKTDKPVKTIPYWVTAECDKHITREKFGLPENQFLFLVAYDKNSIAERKNPQGCIQAFKKAFSPDVLDVGLIIKINHAAEQDINQLKRQLTGYNAYFISDELSRSEMDSLVKLVDVYVSLHRAEGFGLILAEAMLLGTPVIATNYSANTEFMNDEVACMVDYNLVILKEDIWPYEKGSYWAEPDVEQAAEYIRKLYLDSDYYNAIKVKAQKYITKQLSEKRIVDLIRSRCEDIFNFEKEMG